MHVNVDKRRAGLWADSPDLSALFLPPAEKWKAKADQENRHDPRKRECVVQHRECWAAPEHCADPDDAESAGAEHCTDGRIQGMPPPAQGARRNFVEAAKRLKQQNAQNAHTGALNYRLLRCEQPGEKAAEPNDGEDRDGAADR